MDYVALAAELTAGHPVTGAYSADAQTAAQEINEANISRIRASMSGSELWANTDSGEYAVLSDQKKLEWLNFCGIDSHNPEAGGLAQAFVVYIFGGGSATVSALSAARNELISRADELGLGRVLEVHVIEARAL